MAAERLTEELLNYELRVDEDATEKFGAFRAGTYDDLVTALGLATQIDPSELEEILHEHRTR